jgi:lipopolysaccharide/colanic/teichoic acid biosynthesis glycosyltransferase
MKRFLDIIIASVALVLLSPVLLIVALAILLTMGTPILFRQQRPGLNGRPFGIVKFRTMRALRPGEEAVASDGRRLTRLGRFLRAASLDELPELWNVLKGDMSLVGPRPLLMHYLPLYSPEQARRHEVRPGLTGWAQVKGRNALSWDEKFALDVWYVDHRSTWLDLRILAATVGQVLGRRGIAAEGSATMHEFRGNAPAPAEADRR